jgi:hypothetical protein
MPCEEIKGSISLLYVFVFQKYFKKNNFFMFLYRFDVLISKLIF